MTRRWTLLAGALALSLSVPQAAFATPRQTATAPAPGPDAAAADALRDLKGDADGAVRVQRDADGDVAFVSSTDGQAMVDSDTASPRRAAQEQLATYGDAFGIDGSTSKAVVTQTLDSATGGSVVRVDQVVDGVPVFGGQVVMSLDEDQGLVSATSATTDAIQVPAAEVRESQAARTAVRIVTRTHKVSEADLTVAPAGRHLYDPAIVHEDDPMGARPVWQFEVTNGSDIRETVLIGTGRGEVALHFNDAPGINRRVCDNASLQATSSSQAVPVCPAPARSEGLPASVVSADINKAYDNLGATSDAYDQLAGIDLTALIGATVTGIKYLQSTVRWCFSDVPCPYQNAFWDGTQMVFGPGWAAADDVVGHELTHGYVERTAGLFALHQSGAINESVSDTIGEIVDHRNPLSTQVDTDWKVGEDLPVLALRSMKNPPLYGQPDKMTSTLFDDGDLNDDGGAVHANDGVGNKTAYLISQGGAFNGQSVTGIDAGDTTLAKTGRLYLETIPRLNSGAQYADLGRVLASTCDELVASATAGFDSDDCVAVRAAVLATELAKKPTKAGAANPEAPASCSTDARQVEVLRDDEAQQDFDFVNQLHWQRTPDNDTPTYARSGDSSWFAWDPDVSDPAQVSSLISGPFTVPSSAGQSTYLHFNHAYVFAWANAQGGEPAWYPDGGQALVQTLSGGTWTTRTLPWVNGPTKSLDDTATKAFGGDSHGYGSSRLDLTPIAGQTARVIFKVSGNYGLLAGIGWWIDDIRLFSCVASASAPATTVAVSGTSAKVSWTPPTFVDSSPVASYRITRSGGSTTTAPASARSVTLTGLNPSANVTVGVAAVTGDGHVGAASSVPIYATNTATAAVAKIKKNIYFNITSTVTRRGTTTRVPGIKVTLQRHLKGKTTWANVASGTTNSAGAKAFRVRQSALTYYRVVTTGAKTWLGSTSAARTVGLR